MGPSEFSVFIPFYSAAMTKTPYAYAAATAYDFDPASAANSRFITQYLGGTLMLFIKAGIKSVPDDPAVVLTIRIALCREAENTGPLI